MLKKSLIILIFFIFNKGVAQLPYSDLARKSNQSRQNGIVNIIDSLGYTYFDITDKLITEDLNKEFKSSTIQLLLFEIYKASINILQSVSRDKINPKFFTITATFSQLRENTLLNLERSSEISSENKDILLYLDFKNFTRNLNSIKGFYS